MENGWRKVDEAYCMFILCRLDDKQKDFKCQKTHMSQRLYVLKSVFREPRDPGTYYKALHPICYQGKCFEIKAVAFVQF